jgi:hypothetical protein
MPVLCRIPVDPGCFLGAGIVIPAHFGVWDRDPGWVPGQRHLCRAWAIFQGSGVGWVALFGLLFLKPPLIFKKNFIIHENSVTVCLHNYKQYASVPLTQRWHWPGTHLGSRSQTPKCAGITIPAPKKQPGSTGIQHKKGTIPGDPRFALLLLFKCNSLRGGNIDSVRLSSSNSSLK